MKDEKKDRPYNFSAIFGDEFVALDIHLGENTPAGHVRFGEEQRFVETTLNRYIMARARWFRLVFLGIRRTEIIGTALRTEVGITFSSSCITWALLSRTRRTATTAGKAIITFHWCTTTVFLTEITRTCTITMFIARFQSIMIAWVVGVTLLFQAQIVMVIQEEMLMAPLPTER